MSCNRQQNINNRALSHSQSSFLDILHQRQAGTAPTITASTVLGDLLIQGEHRMPSNQKKGNLSHLAQ